MITNENEFLGLLIKNMNDKHECYHSKSIPLSGLDDISYMNYCKSLKQKGYIATDAECVYLTQQGIASYTPPVQKIADSVLKTSKFTLKTFLEILVGVVVAVLAAFLIYHLGWE